MDKWNRRRLLQAGSVGLLGGGAYMSATRTGKASIQTDGNWTVDAIRISTSDGTVSDVYVPTDGLDFQFEWQWITQLDSPIQFSLSVGLDGSDYTLLWSDSFTVSDTHGTLTLSNIEWQNTDGFNQVSLISDGGLDSTVFTADPGTINEIPVYFKVEFNHPQTTFSNTVNGVVEVENTTPVFSDPNDSEPSNLSTVLGNMDGSGTSSDPYIIRDDHDLQAVRSDKTAHYVLGQNIDASQTETWYSGSGFDPIGINNDEFRGSFDGQYYTIKGLTISRPSEDAVALFGQAKRGTIQNVALTQADITGNYYVGALVGRFESGTVTSSYSTGSIHAKLYQVGGLVGRQTGGTIRDSYSRASVTGDDGDWIGGFLGYYGKGTMEDTYWDTEASGVSSSASSATGLTTAEMTGTAAKGNMTGLDFEGTWITTSNYPQFR